MVSYIFSILVLAICFILASKGRAEVNIKWFGTSNIIIADETNAIAFDPFFTRPNLLQLLSKSHIPSRQAFVDEVLAKGKVKQIEAIFVSHSHYDHVLDLATLGSRFGSQLIVDANARSYALSLGYDKVNIIQQKAFEQHQFGQFKVTVLPSQHAPHLSCKVFLNGKSESPFPQKPNVLDFRALESYAYLIEHPHNTVFFSPSSLGDLGEMFPDAFPSVDIVIVSIASRMSTDHLLNSLVLPLQPKFIVPVHHDNMFRSLNRGLSFSNLVDVDEFLQSSEDSLANARLVFPEYFSALSF